MELAQDNFNWQHRALGVPIYYRIIYQYVSQSSSRFLIQTRSSGKKKKKKKKKTKREGELRELTKLTLLLVAVNYIFVPPKLKCMEIILM
jgi:hypothetical protein